MELPEAIELGAKVHAALAKVNAALEAGDGWNTTTANALSMAEANLQRAAALSADLVADLELKLKVADEVDREALSFLAGQIQSRLVDDDKTRRTFFTMEYRDGGLVIHPFAVAGSYRLRLEPLPEEMKF